MTKNAPATPLPWEQMERYIEHGDGAESMLVTTASHFLKDAEYIAHTANAYPKLVAALQAMCDYSAITWAQDCENEPQHAQEARVLLRELGEL